MSGGKGSNYLKSNYHKVMNISPGLIEVCKKFCGLIYGKLIFGGLYLEGLLGEQLTCVYQKIHHSVSNQRTINNTQKTNLQKDTIRYRCSILALCMVIYSPK